MDKNTVLEQLKVQHREIELDVGNDPDCVADDIQPLDDLPGFDSLLIPNVIRGVARAMGIDLPNGTRLRNPYVGRDGSKLSLHDVAKRFCQLYGKEAKKK